MVVDTKLYNILGVAEDADASTLKKAYRELVKKHHPDKGGDPEKFKEIDAAYKVLSNDELRGIYDSTGSVKGSQMQGFDMGDMDILNHIFQSMNFDIFGGGGMRGTQGFPFARKQRTRDVVHEIHLPLESLYAGKVKTIAIKRNVVCKDCSGKGGSDPKPCNVCQSTGMVFVQQHCGGGMIMQTQRPCTTCDGKGKTHTRETVCGKCTGKGHHSVKEHLEVVVPAGTRDGFVVTKKGFADEHVGFETGDFHFVIREKPHGVYTRSGDDLRTKVAIDLTTALVGGNVRFEHIDGSELQVTLPKGKVTRFNDTLTIQGKGMPKMSDNSTHGDLHVTFHIEMPSNDWAKKVDETIVRKILSN